MKVKISDRESEVKMARWMNGEVGIYNKSEVNCGLDRKYENEYLEMKNKIKGNE